MSLRNPIKYTSRTFASILADINSDEELIDKPSWYKRLIAGLGDVFSLLIDAEHNNAYLGTTFTRRATTEAARMIDYEASPRTTATRSPATWPSSSETPSATTGRSCTRSSPTTV